MKSLGVNVIHPAQEKHHICHVFNKILAKNWCYLWIHFLNQVKNNHFSYFFHSFLLLILIELCVGQHGKLFCPPVHACETGKWNYIGLVRTSMFIHVHAACVCAFKSVYIRLYSCRPIHGVHIAEWRRLWLTDLGTCQWYIVEYYLYL